MGCFISFFVYRYTTRHACQHVSDIGFLQFVRMPSRNITTNDDDEAQLILSKIHAVRRLFISYQSMINAER
jgi:hypothetical protein